MPATHAHARRLFIHAADAVALADELQGGAFIVTRLASRLGPGERIVLNIYAPGCHTIAEVPVVVVGRSFESKSNVGVFVKLDPPAVLAVEHSAPGA